MSISGTLVALYVRLLTPLAGDDDAQLVGPKGVSQVFRRGLAISPGRMVTDEDSRVAQH
jgi:hypothetical protein